MPPKIHPTAIVHDGAMIGDDVVIGPYSIIGENVTIGNGTYIQSNVIVDGYTTIGIENRIFHGAAIGNPPQDLKYEGEKTFVRIGDRNTIRECVTVNLAAGEGESTVIGNDCLLMAYVHVAHNCVLGDHVILANAVNPAGHVTIEDYAIIGGLVPVHQFVSIGAHSFIGGGSRIAQDVLPYFKYAGSPPK
ncbi:MAG TPA: acyl-ACP--UDP-N-acetylglucosamine O-acyltransferase, partial [Candidatus Krumholzibacterium sp.]|nr:acyl-ACP--UDP-N-acetylglucosamine O-acyltransferase [Candidatus Krumholzibacterium sp.]